MMQKDLSKTGNFDPYFKQLDVVREAAAKETYSGKRKGMNRFLEMLEAKEGGISTAAAHHIFRTVVNEVPYTVLLLLKSEDKLDPEEKVMIERMKRFAAAIRDQDQRAGDDALIGLCVPVPFSPAKLEATVARTERARDCRGCMSASEGDRRWWPARGGYSR